MYEYITIMSHDLSMDDFILIDDKFNHFREQIGLLIQKYNKMKINYDGINELFESSTYDEFINGSTMTRDDIRLIHINAIIMKRRVDSKLNIIENIFRTAGVDISMTERPPGYDWLLGMARGLQSIYDATY